MAATPGVTEQHRSDDVVLREAVDLIRALDDRGVTARILGGVGIVLHCDSLCGRPHRPIADIDLITPRRSAAGLPDALKERGYEPVARFNAMHGDTRMMFTGPAGKVDVFIDELVMCHRLDFRSRLELEPQTLSATDLLLTKLQIVELNEKDVADIRALLLDHELGQGPGDLIEVDYLCSLVRDNWGLWRTVTGTLRRIGDGWSELSEKAGTLRDRMDAVEKGRRFRLRARIGERKRWYELPDEAPAP